jgi:hypothetical protein
MAAVLEEWHETVVGETEWKEEEREKSFILSVFSTGVPC